MNDRASDDLRRLTDLLGDRASGSLSDAEASELERLLAAVESADAIASGYDRVEGGLVGAFHATGDPLPASLRSTLIESGRGVVAKSVSEHRSGDAGPIPMAYAPDGRMRVVESGGAWGSWRARLGWVAAAAALALAAVAWWPTGASDLEPTLSEQRARLERRATDTVTAVLDVGSEGLRATAPGATLIADVVWSDVEQRGYLRVRGLRANDPRVEQYQVWITDATRDAPSRVSAAVFDVEPGSVDPVNGAVVIEIDPGLRIGRAVAFTVTIEPAGGVVVSDGTRIVLQSGVG